MKWTKYISFCCLAITLTACEKDTDATSFAPTVTTGNATDIYRKGATLSGSIKLTGTSTAESYGILFSKLKSMAESTEYPIQTGETSYEINIQGLEPGTTYYYCSYAHSGFSTSRGEIKNFTTTENNAPVFDALNIDSIAPDRVFVSTNVLDDGGAELILSGICWREGNSGVATYIDNVINVTEVQSNKLSAVVTGLKPETDYVMAAYSVNTNGMGFSKSIVVRTSETKVPILSQVVPKDSTNYSVTLEAQIKDAGTSAITKAGFCWSETNKLPTVNDNSNDLTEQLANGNMKISASLSDLKPSTTYYIRPYAINAEGISYGEVFEFTTAEPKTPTLSAITPQNSADYSVTLEALIKDAGTSAITKAGFCWSDTNKLPTVDDNSNDLTQQLANGNMKISASLSDLKPSTTYYIRPYAINAEGISYGEVFEFTTAEPKAPTLSAITPKDSTDVSITLEVTIIDKGLSELLKAGFCWGTANEPTINNSYYNDLTSQLENDNLKLISTMSIGNNFIENTTYYIRAYATNSVGTSYSKVFTFKTGLKNVENGNIILGGGEYENW